MSLNTIPTHELAESYVTLTEANAYLENRLDVAEWTALTNAQKEAVLKLATKQIDSNRFFEEPFLDDNAYYRAEQLLKFPLECAKSVVGSVTSATTNTITSNLINNINYPDDWFNEWGIIITEGAGRGKTYKISDYVSATGLLTIEGTFTVALDSTSRFILVEKIPVRVRYATIEQALFIVKSGGDRARLQAEGVKSYSIGDLSETFGSGNINKITLSSDAKGYLKGLISKIGVLN